MAGFLRRILQRKKGRPPVCAAVVTAAGSSTRMGEDKLLMDLMGECTLVHTLRALDSCPLIHEIILVTGSDRIVDYAQRCRAAGIAKLTQVVVGGETRTQSSLAGVNAVSPETELIAIHDGARPFLTQELLEAVLTKGAACGAAAPAVPLKDTVKRVEGETVTETLERSALRAVQTPQVFDAALIKAALTRAAADGTPITDDCAAVERLGMQVVLTAGSEENIKLTTPADMIHARAILEGRELL